MGTVFLVERADGQYEQRGRAETGARACRRRRMRISPVRARAADFWRRSISARSATAHGGQTEDGRLYFVMEYVEGRPIDVSAQRDARDDRSAPRSCSRKSAPACSTRFDRLVVHRRSGTVKHPATDTGDVKLLDFGIAKLLSDDTAAPATRLLTPEYPAPEQWRGDPVAIASDVYQLGLLLYELLTGEPAQSLSARRHRHPTSSSASSATTRSRRSRARA